MSANIIRACVVPHYGACDAVLSDGVVVDTLEAHGFEARIVHTGVEAFEPSTTFSFTPGVPAVDSSTWVAVPSGVHGLAEWLGY